MGKPYAPGAATGLQKAKPSHSCSTSGGRTAHDVHKLSTGDENNLMHRICLLLMHANCTEALPASPAAPERVPQQLG